MPSTLTRICRSFEAYNRLRAIRKDGDKEPLPDEQLGEARGIIRVDPRDHTWFARMDALPGGRRISIPPFALDASDGPVSPGAPLMLPILLPHSTPSPTVENEAPAWQFPPGPSSAPSPPSPPPTPPTPGQRRSILQRELANLEYQMAPLTARRKAILQELRGLEAHSPLPTPRRRSNTLAPALAPSPLPRNTPRRRPSAIYVPPAGVPDVDLSRSRKRKASEDNSPSDPSASQEVPNKRSKISTVGVVREDAVGSPCPPPSNPSPNIDAAPVPEGSPATSTYSPDIHSVD